MHSPVRPQSGPPSSSELPLPVPVSLPSLFPSLLPFFSCFGFGSLPFFGCSSWYLLLSNTAIFSHMVNDGTICLNWGWLMHVVNHLVTLPYGSRNLTSSTCA